MKVARPTLGAGRRRVRGGAVRSRRGVRVDSL